MDWPETHVEQIEVLQRFIDIGGINTKPHDVAQFHVCPGKDGLQIVQRRADLAAHVAGVLRIALGVDSSLTGADQMTRDAFNDLGLIIAETTTALERFAAPERDALKQFHVLRL